MLSWKGCSMLTNVFQMEHLSIPEYSIVYSLHFPITTGRSTLTGRSQFRGITRKVSRRKRVCYPATRLRSDPAWEGSGFCIPYNLVTFPDWLYSIWVILQRNQVKSPEARCQVMRNPGRDAHPFYFLILAALTRPGCE